MTEYRPKLRRGGGARDIDLYFEDAWIGLAMLGTTSWGYPDQGKNARYRAEADRWLTLFLTAPKLLEALEHCEAALEAAMALSEDPSLPCPALDEARAALREAKGEKDD